MDLEKQFRKQIKQKGWLRSQDKVVVAVSTGVDSMVLLHLLKRLPASLRPKLIVAYVNHKLRPESDTEQAFLENYCLDENLTLRTADWPMNDHPDTGVEAAARQFRYAFFKRVMREERAAILMTAHHENDLAETILMKLLRGGDVKQLIGIRAVQDFETGKLVRPLLSFTKADLRAFAKTQQLTWFEDATNEQDETLRNRIRHHVMPLLQRENEQFLLHIQQYSEQLAQQQMVVADWAEQTAQELKGKDGINLPAFCDLPDAQQAVFLRWYLQQGQESVSELTLMEVLQLIHNETKPQGEVYLTHEWRFVKQYETFFLNNCLNSIENRGTDKKTVLDLNHWKLVSETQQIGLFTGDSDENTFLSVSLRDAELPLWVRPVESGDQLTLKSGGHQLVRRIQIDQKVPNSQRASDLVVVTQENEILSLVNRKNAWREADQNATYYQLKLKNLEERNG